MYKQCRRSRNEDVESTPVTVIFLVSIMGVVQTEDGRWLTRHKQTFFEESRLIILWHFGPPQDT